MDDLRQDSQTGLPTECFALCSEHFEALCFSRSVVIGTPVDFKRLYLEKGSVRSIYAKPKDSLETDCPRNKGKLANRFFPRNVLWTFLWNPTEKRQYPKITPPPIDFFTDWVGLFEICFRSSKMTDPRPCPTGCAYFRAFSRSTKTCQSQTSNKLSTSKICIS